MTKRELDAEYEAFIQALDKASYQTLLRFAHECNIPIGDNRTAFKLRVRILYAINYEKLVLPDSIKG